MQDSAVCPALDLGLAATGGELSGSPIVSVSNREGICTHLGIHVSSVTFLLGTYRGIHSLSVNIDDGRDNIYVQMPPTPV